MAAPYFDPETGFAYPGAEAPPFQYTATKPELEEALSTMILSASGWRKVYAAHEEDTSPGLRPVDRVLAFGMAEAFVDFLQDKTGPLKVALGVDARFTGPALADALLRVLVARGVEVDYLGIVAAPQIMAWVPRAGHSGFAYVSASHNPIGHNGLKFGLADGGVVGGADAAELIRRFRASVSPDHAAAWTERAAAAPTGGVARVLQGMPAARRASERAYTALSDRILTVTDEAALQKKRKSELAGLLRTRGLGVVGELNGSARGLSIDRPWLESLGVTVTQLNHLPRQIVHRIVPEGPSLDLCCRELERLHALDADTVLGYVPDCDGDRGNVVFFDSAAGRARALEAQEGFALCVLSELAGLAYYGEGGKVAVVCNDPTSLRIEAIAAAWGARVARAEVGEANVVNRARELRAEGWTVRILGEGSNGGNITYPGAVRDPLSTLGSLIKLLSLRSLPGRPGVAPKPGLFELWCLASDQKSAYREDFTLADVLATLPAWTTVPTSDERAILSIRSSDHGVLKARFEDLWQNEAWPRLRDEFARRWGVATWEEFNYEGTQERAGVGAAFRTGKQSGGLKILLKNRGGEGVAALWMRGSGTEPVFRILTEVRGRDKDGELWLCAQLTALVRTADAATSQ